MNKVLAITGNILALAIFGVGLISPLTPSTGTPAMGFIFTFVGLPLILLLYAWLVYLNQVAKSAVVVEGLCIVGFASCLSILQAGGFASSS